MKVLMITGDRKFGPGHERYELQKSAVDKLAVVYWGAGSYWPNIPAGQFDVVTAQDPFWRGLFGWWVAKKKKAKLNIQVHASLDVPIYHNMGTRWKLWLGKVVLQCADSVRVVSEKIKEQVECMRVQAPITVLPVFVELERFKKISPIAHEQKTILWIGRFEPEKNPLGALELFKKVREEGIDAKLVMLGQGSLESQLHARAGAATLPGAVHLVTGGVAPPALVEFPGWQDPTKYLAQADVVLCTSLHESWGASIVEALAAGVPVVAPDVGIAREAGAFTVAREELTHKVIEVLYSGQRGELKLSVPTKSEWAALWRKSLTESRVKP